MDLRHIQYFISLYEEGSVTRAARRLHVVQPALSMQLAKLERQVEQKLFDRGPRGMVPTAAGRAMYELYAPLLRDFARARMRLENMKGEISGAVSVGIIFSITQRELLRTVAAFAKRYPAVRLTLSEGYTATLCEWVTAGELDFVIVNRVPEKLNLDVENIFTDEFIYSVASSSRLRNTSTISLRELARRKLVLPSKRHRLRTMLEEHAAALDVRLEPELELDAINGIAELVRTTNFGTVLPSATLRQDLLTGSLKGYPIAPTLKRDVICVHHPRRPLTPAAARLRSMMIAALRKDGSIATGQHQKR